MGILDFVKKSVSDLFIASPQEAAGRLIWKHPDQSIPQGCKVTVRSDEAAVFFKEGRVAGVLDAGTFHIDSANIPFLGDLVVSPLTGDNHYLTELFFVRKAEYLHQTTRPLGTFNDIASRLLVSVGFRARYGVRITDPVALIATLAGQHSTASDQVTAYLDGRVSSLVSSCVGKLLASEPVTQVVSNQHAEELGQQVLARARDSFASEGLLVTRFLELHLALDSASEAALRDYGQKLAELSIQREGAEIAREPGFARYHLVQGQRALMEGLAAGSASGQAVLPPLGLAGFGAIGTAPVSPPPAPELALPPTPHGSVSSARIAPSPSRPTRWYLRTPRGIEGPYAVRQLVIRATAAGLEPSSALVRPEGSDSWKPLGDDEELSLEFGRRAQSLSPTPSGSDPAGTAARLFECALQAAVNDKILTADELAMLVPLAVQAMLASEVEARDYVTRRASALGCTVTADKTANAAVPPGPPPPPLPSGKVFLYSNGVQESQGMTAQAIAARVRAAPDGVHLVWTQGMTQWNPAAEVDEIATLLR